MTNKLLPYKVEGSQRRVVQVNDILTHPFAASGTGASRDRWRYRFLRVTRQPTIDRPHSGRILVENEVTGARSDFYALLFNVSF